MALPGLHLPDDLIGTFEAALAAPRRWLTAVDDRMDDVWEPFLVDDADDDLDEAVLPASSPPATVHPLPVAR